MYSRARRAASSEARRRLQAVSSPSQPGMMTPQQQMPVLPSPPSQTVPKAKPAMTPPRCEVKTEGKMSGEELEEWTQIPVETPVVKENVKGKRSLSTSTPSMEIQPDVEKVSQLQAQIAILQRELQKEISGGSAQQSPESN